VARLPLVKALVVGGPASAGLLLQPPVFNKGVTVAEVTVEDVAATVLSVIVVDSGEFSSGRSGTLERLFMAKDRGRVIRSWSLLELERNAVEWEVVRVRDGLRMPAVEPTGMGLSSAGPWPLYSSQNTRCPSISCGE
jgi:hypothetical protein